ncbi:MAG: diguanylate cyclase, partial [Ruminiclostridium sp.]|nr:diguanylate cyclase [Ruminiclostridium sp.]
MELFVKFAVDNYVLIIMLVGMFILTSFDAFLGRKMIRRLRITLLMLLALVAADSLEYLAAQLSQPSFQRILMSAIGYSLRPIIVMMLIMLIYKNAHWLLGIPAALNIIVSFSAFFTDLAYGFSEINTFYRGPLGYTAYIVSLFYIGYLFFVSFRVFANGSGVEGFIVMFIAVTASLSAMFALGGYDDVVNQTFAAEILLYYLYVYGQYTRRDALTGLFNRHSFYSDIEKNASVISGIISIDMNELKGINDTLSHDEGDKALK